MIFEPLKLVRTLSFEDLNYLVLYHPPRCVPGAHLRLRSPGSNGRRCHKVSWQEFLPTIGCLMRLFNMISYGLIWIV